MGHNKQLRPAPALPGENPSYLQLREYVSIHGIARASYRFNLSEAYIEERLELGELPPEVVPVPSKKEEPAGDTGVR